MRTVTLEIDGQTVEMPVNFAAGTELAKAGYDPLQMSLQADLRSKLTSHAVIKILHVGARAAGSKLTVSQLGEEVYDKGVLAFVPAAMEYLASFVAAEPEYPVRSDPKEIAPTPTH